MTLRELKLSELLKFTEELLKEINTRKRIIRQEFIKQGYIMEAERLSYENIDTTDLEEKLMLVLYSYHKNGKYLLSSIEKDKVERICLAAMCQFIKGEYHVRSYTIDYTNLTGLKVDNRLYRILENSFKKEGILPKNWDKMKGFRYKDTLINETGIPKHLANDLIDLFKIYWKNLRQFDFEYVFENINTIMSRNYIWDVKEIETLKNNHIKLQEYPRKVKKVVKQLSDVCTLLEEGNYYEEDLTKKETVDTINKVLKFDIFTILPRRESLRLLYIQILSKVSVNKFRNILENAPLNTQITIPDKARVSPRQYKNLQLGVHNISSPIYRIYTVLPHASVSINQLLKFHKERYTKVSDTHIGYRSSKKFDIKIGKTKKDTSYPLYEHGRLQGYYWYGKTLNGVPITINNNVYEPDQFIHYNPIFKYSYNNEINSYTYNLLLNSFKIYIPPYASEKLVVNCNYSNESKYIRIDKDGYNEEQKIIFNINKKIINEPISIEVYHDNKGIYEILYKEDIKDIEDVDIYVKNLEKSKANKTKFEYELKNREWRFDNKRIFHIEDHCLEKNKVVTNIKNAQKEVEVLAHYNKKYNKFLLEDIVQNDENTLFIDHDKLRTKLGIDEDSAKIRLIFLHNYERIFDANIITIKNINIQLDSNVYVSGDRIEINCKYKEHSETEVSNVEIIRHKDTLIPKLIPVSIYIDELDSYYTQYVKPNILGYIIKDKYNGGIMDIDSLHYDNVDRYKIQIQSSINDDIEVYINNNKVDIGSNDIMLEEHKDLFRFAENTIIIKQSGKSLEFRVNRDIQKNIFQKPNTELKWYEIDEKYSSEDLKNDIGLLGSIFKTL